MGNSNEKFVTDIVHLQQYVKDELNIEEMIFGGHFQVSREATLNFKVLGKRLGKDMKAVQQAIKAVSQNELEKVEQGGELVVCGHVLSSQDMAISQHLSGVDDPNWDFNGDGSSLVVMDFSYDETLAQKAVARDIVNRVQRMRKALKLQADDVVDMWAWVAPNVEAADDTEHFKCVACEGSGWLLQDKVLCPLCDVGYLQSVLDQQAGYMNKSLRGNLWPRSMWQGHEDIMKREEINVDGGKIVLTISHPAPHFNTVELSKLAGGDEDVVRGLKNHLQSFTFNQLHEICKDDGNIVVRMHETDFAVRPGVHFGLGPCNAHGCSSES